MYREIAAAAGRRPAPRTRATRRRRSSRRRAPSARETDDPASPTRAHRELTAAQIAAYEAAGRRPVIRFKTPLGGSTEIVDLVRGHVTWENRLLGDHVLLRADGIATYQLANPLDDVHHGMTHVIRGDDLLSSTPRQKLLLEALGHTYPVTAHLPQILGADKKRLSKRHGAASVEEFRDAGYVPEAVVNYLALVGWSYDDSTELMTVEELIERFTIDRVSASPGVFDHQKLAWMNGVYLRGLTPDDYAARLRAYLADRGSPIAFRDELADAVPLVQEKIGALGEFEEFAGFLFHPVVYDDDAWQKVAVLPEAPAILRATAQALETAPGVRRGRRRARAARRGRAARPEAAGGVPPAARRDLGPHRLPGPVRVDRAARARGVRRAAPRRAGAPGAAVDGRAGSGHRRVSRSSSDCST